MLSPADIMIIGAAALIFFGPDQLPKVAKRAGQVVREVQNTSQSFIREMERAADETEMRERVAAARVTPPEATTDVEEPSSHEAEDDVPDHEPSDEMLLPFGNPILGEHETGGVEVRPEPAHHESYEI